MSVALKKSTKKTEKFKILKKLKLENNRQIVYVADHPITLDEFWIIDQPRKQMQALITDETTKRFVPMQTEGTILRSSVLKGFWLNVDWLWKKPLPSVLEVFKEIAGAL